MSFLCGRNWSLTLFTLLYIAREDNDVPRNILQVIFLYISGYIEPVVYRISKHSIGTHLTILAAIY